MENSQKPEIARAGRSAAERPDEELASNIVAIAAGDRAAFRRAYAISSAKMFAICLNVTRDRSTAEDLLQEVYIKLWSNAQAFDPARSRPLAWLAVIARNTAIDWYRSRSKFKYVGEEQLKFVAHEAEAVDDRIVRMETESEAMRMATNEDGSIDADLKRIFFQGLTYVQAAQQEGVPLGTMKSRVRRAVLKVRRGILND